MVEKPINLRIRRKQKAREDKRKRSDQATSARGVTQVERLKSLKQNELNERQHDGHHLKPDGEDND